MTSRERILIHREIIEKLSMEEKFRLLTGIDVNATYPLNGVDVKSMRCHDGPFGVRMPEGKNEYASRVRSAFPNCWDGEEAVATAFPTGCAMGATWNRDLVRRHGEAIGKEYKAYCNHALRYGLIPVFTRV